MVTEADAENLNRGANQHQGHHDALGGGKLALGAPYEMGHLSATGGGPWLLWPPR